MTTQPSIESLRDLLVSHANRGCRTDALCDALTELETLRAELVDYPPGVSGAEVYQAFNERDAAEARNVALGARVEALEDGLKEIVAHANKVGDGSGHWWYLNYAQTLLLTPWTYSLSAHDARIRREEREAAWERVAQSTISWFLERWPHFKEAILSPAPDAENKEPK